MLFKLFLSFFKIGAFTFGGGYAMIPLIEREVIERRNWIVREEFVDLLTLAQSAPGPISLNTAVFVGYKLRGYRGAVASILGAALPSFLIILLVALFFQGIRSNALVEAAFKGMRPAVVALILYPVISLARGMKPTGYVVLVAAAMLIHLTGCSPILLLLAAALCGVGYGVVMLKKRGGRP